MVFQDKILKRTMIILGVLAIFPSKPINQVVDPSKPALSKRLLELYVMTCRSGIPTLLVPK